MDLVEGIYRLAGQLPETEKYGLVSQLRRCSVSIPSNIAEGYGRNSTGDYLRFLAIAKGSARELQTLLLLVDRLNLAGVGSLVEETDRVAALIYGLSKSVERSAYRRSSAL